MRQPNSPLVFRRKIGGVAQRADVGRIPLQPRAKHEKAKHEKAKHEKAKHEKAKRI